MIPNRIRKQNSWPKQNAVIISNEQNLIAILRNQLTAIGWQIVGHYPTAIGGAFAVREGRANLIIADDLPDQPIGATLRFLLTHPITVCTPVLALCGPSTENEAKVLRTMGRPHVLQKPITPSRIQSTFDSLLQEWGAEDMVRLRQAASSMQNGDTQGGILTLKQLLNTPLAPPQAAQALALLLRQINKFKEAEALLLACLKRDRQNFTVIFGLADLYLSAAMPSLAHKLLSATSAKIQPSLALYPDLIQAALLMDNCQEAITHLQTLLESGYNVRETTHFLARLLFALGREKEAATLLARHKDIHAKYAKAWQVADQIPLPVAG